MTDLATVDKTALVRNTLTIDEIKAHVGIIHNVMKEVMKNGTHYGKIPGCGEKPTLLKPGAEKIQMTFQLTPSVMVEDLSLPGERRYRVKVTLSSRDGTPMGDGVGECSSDEDKYKWRAAVCDAEWEDTPEDKRRIKWDKYGDKKKQVRTNPADIANTVLKMAKKRAQVDACLTTTAASDIFVQDIEDLPEELLNGRDEKHDKKPEAPKSPPQKPLAQYRQELIGMIKDLSGGNTDEAKKYVRLLGYEKTSAIPDNKIIELHSKVAEDYKIAFQNNTAEELV